MKITQSQSSAAELLNPGSSAWSGATAEAVSLSPVPLDAQPNAYIQKAWADRAYGTTGEASASAQSAGDQVYIRLQFADDATPNTEFPDAAGVVIGSGDAIGTLGASGKPVSLWVWTDGRDGQALSSEGPGVVRKTGDGLQSAGESAGGQWSVVIAGPKSALSGNQLGVVVWNGSNEERAGLAAVSAGLAIEE